VSAATPFATGVVARWTARRRPGPGAVCEECATPLVDIACECCGQLVGRAVGMLATVVDTPAGPQLVIAERSPAGGWTPLRRFPATREALRALARPGATGPQTHTETVGGLS
jgi:hypothetical protein